MSVETSENGVIKIWVSLAKEFLPELSAVWACTLKSVCQPSPRLKKFKEYQF